MEGKCETFPVMYARQSYLGAGHLQFILCCPCYKCTWELTSLPLEDILDVDRTRSSKSHMHTYIRGKIAFCCKTRAWPATGIGSVSPTILLFVIQTGKPEYEFSIHIWYWLAPNCKAKAKRCNIHRVSICLYWSESSQGEMMCLQLFKGNLQCKIVWCSHLVCFYDTLLEDCGYLSMCNQLGKQTSWFFLYKLINTDFIAVTSNDRHGVSNYQYCLFNSLFRLTTKKHQRSALLCLMRGMIPLTKGQ